MTVSLVDFFARYAELEGALAEVVAEGALLVFPGDVSQKLGLPDETAVTVDPEVAREDGYVLLAAGHPLVRNAAQWVLDRGDVGCSHLPWPVGLPPSPSWLEERARSEVGVDHGRVVVSGAPTGAHLPALQVGALLSYSISMEELVQEIEQVWVDAGSGHLLDPRLRAALERGLGFHEPGAPMSASDAGWAWRESWAPAVAVADAALRRRAQLRAEELGRQAAGRVATQLAAVDDYYRQVLTSIDERRTRSAPERQGMLDSQREATASEWARRRSEVADEWTPTFEVRPFRFHLVAVPAWRVDALVERGARSYPLDLVFTPLTNSFVPPVCPTCGAVDGLVATKHTLQCRSCIEPEVQSAEQAAAEPGVVVVPAVVDPAKNEPVTRAPERPAAAGPSGTVGTTAATKGTNEAHEHQRVVGHTPDRRTAPGRKGNGRTTPKGTTGRVTPRGGGAAPDNELRRRGSRLAVAFWETALAGKAAKSRDVLEFSPIDTLFRLYGGAGPALVVGVTGNERIDEITTMTAPFGQGTKDTVSTSGDLIVAGAGPIPYSLRWRPTDANRFVELEGGIDLRRLGYFTFLAQWRRGLEEHRQSLAEYFRPAPVPTIDIGDADRRLLETANEWFGLAFAIRCLAAWFYLDEVVDRHDRSSELEVGAIETVVARRAGLKAPADDAARRYGCDIEVLRRDVRRIQVLLKGVTGYGW